MQGTEAELAGSPSRLRTVVSQGAIRVAALLLVVESWMIAMVLATTVYSTADAHRFFHWDCEGSVPSVDRLLYEVGAGSSFSYLGMAAFALFAFIPLLHLVVAGESGPPGLPRRALVRFLAALGASVLLGGGQLCAIFLRPQHLALRRFLEPRATEPRYGLWGATWMLVLVCSLPVVAVVCAMVARGFGRRLAVVAALASALMIPGPEVAARFLSQSYLCVAEAAPYRGALLFLGWASVLAAFVFSTTIEVRSAIAARSARRAAKP